MLPTPPDAATPAEANRDRGSRDGPALIAATVVTICLLGDAMLYLVLPANAEAFGLSAFWVGVALSINRFIRLFLNQPAALVIQRVGLRAATVGGAVLSVLSTAAYGLVLGAAAFVIARSTWGAAFATLRLTSLDYATQDRGRAASRLGWVAAIKALGPAGALVAASWAVSAIGPREVFLVLGAITLLAVPLALLLPRPLAGEVVATPRLAFKAPKATETVVFFASLVADGIIMAGVALLLITHGYSTSAAIQVGGLLLATRYASSILVGPGAGWAAQRWGFGGPFAVLQALLIAGLSLLAYGYVVGGAALLISFSAGLQAIAPGIVAARSRSGAMISLSFLATWRDLGAAIGAAIGPLIAVLPLGQSSAVFLAAAVIMLALLAWSAMERPSV